MPSSPAAIENSIKRPLASAGYSRFVQRVRRRHADDLRLLPPGLPDTETITALVVRLQGGGRSLPAALRTARLALARAVQVVLGNGLAILGIEAPARMDRSEEAEPA